MKIPNWDKPGYIISTSVKTTLLEYILKRTDKAYRLETKDMGSWTSYTLYEVLEE